MSHAAKETIRLYHVLIYSMTSNAVRFFHALIRNGIFKSEVLGGRRVKSLTVGDNVKKYMTPKIDS